MENNKNTKTYSSKDIERIYKNFLEKKIKPNDVGMSRNGTKIINIRGIHFYDNSQRFMNPSQIICYQLPNGEKGKFIKPKESDRIEEKKLQKTIKENVNKALKEALGGYTQQDINNAASQWQQQGLQQIRQNNGRQGFTINQVGNNFHSSIPHQNVCGNATVLMSKIKYFYNYVMNNNMESAMEIFGDIQGIIEDTYTNLEAYYNEQKNIQKVGGTQW